MKECQECHSPDSDNQHNPGCTRVTMKEYLSGKRPTYLVREFTLVSADSESLTLAGFRRPVPLPGEYITDLLGNPHEVLSVSRRDIRGVFLARVRV